RRGGVDAVAADEIVDALRRAPDPARVEQTGALPVVAVEAEVERPRSLDEERPPLGEEGFERGEVDDRRIGLHLAEIRIDAPGEGEAWRQRVLDVDAERRARIRSLDQR